MDGIPFNYSYLPEIKVRLKDKIILERMFGLVQWRTERGPPVAAIQASSESTVPRPVGDEMGTLSAEFAEPAEPAEQRKSKECGRSQGG